jgi:four helix bundle protein
METPGKTVPTQTFEQLIVWQKAHEFVLGVYRLTESFTRTEIYGLTSQFRRAAISVAANISEGYKKLGRLDKIRFFNTAQGSLEECHYYLILSRDLRYAEPGNLLPLLKETGKLIQAYSAGIRRRVFATACLISFGLSGLFASALHFWR